MDLPYGFRFASVITAASGLPVNPLMGADNNGDTFRTDRPVGFGRNSFRTPPQVNVDVSLSKLFTLSERVRIQTRAEFF